MLQPCSTAIQHLANNGNPGRVRMFITKIAGATFVHGLCCCEYLLKVMSMMKCTRLYIRKFVKGQFCQLTVDIHPRDVYTYTNYIQHGYM